MCSFKKVKFLNYSKVYSIYLKSFNVALQVAFESGNSLTIFSKTLTALISLMTVSSSTN